MSVNCGTRDEVMCASHSHVQESTFPQSSFTRRNRETMVSLAVSPKKGIYKFNFKDKKQADIKVRPHVQLCL